MPPYRQVARPFGGRYAARHREVRLMDVAGREIFDELQAGAFGKRNDDEAGSILVEAVNHAGARAFLLRQFREMPEQAMHQRSLRAAGAGMHGEPGRLVHHGEVVIAVKYLQRTFLRFHSIGSGRQTKFHLLAGAHLLVGIHAYLPVNRTAALLHQLLEAAARLVAHRTQESVEAGLLSGRHFEDERLFICRAGRAGLAGLFVVQSFEPLKFIPEFFSHVPPPFQVRGAGPEGRQDSRLWWLWPPCGHCCLSR